jgi:hypothetical protein
VLAETPVLVVILILLAPAYFKLAAAQVRVVVVAPADLL